MQFLLKLPAILGFCFLRSMPPAVMVVATALLNPLNVVSSTDRASQDIFFRYIAPLYGQESRHPVTVILLDDDYLTSVGASWPLPHRTMTRFLQTLYCYRPKAVFFDLIFTHEHSGDRQALQLIDYLTPSETMDEQKPIRDRIVRSCLSSFERAEAHALKNGGTITDPVTEEKVVEAIYPLPEVFIGDQAPQAGYPVAGGTVLFDKLAASMAKRLPTNWVADHGFYPLVIELNQEAAASSSDVAAEIAAAKAGSGLLQRVWPDQVDGRLPSAALALYATLQPGRLDFHQHVWPGLVDGELPDDALSRYALLEDDRKFAKLVADQQNQLVVEWGFFPQHLADEAMTLDDHKNSDDRALRRLRQFPADCKVRPENLLTKAAPYLAPATSLLDGAGRQMESFWQFLLDTITVLNTDPGRPRQGCPYNQWIAADAVLNASSLGQQATLRDLFEDRVVMIGADIDGAPDLVQSPVHGQIPGVFLHAMALDNLLERGLGGYWRPMPNLPQLSFLPAIVSKVSIGALVEFGALLAIFWISSLIGYWREAHGKRWSNTLYTSAEMGGHMLLIFSLVTIIAAMAIAPMNWLGLLALAISKDVIQRFELPKIEAGSIMRLRSRPNE